MNIFITYATHEGPLTVCYDTNDTNSWVVPTDSIRIMNIEAGDDFYAPLKNPPKAPKPLEPSQKQEAANVQSLAGIFSHASDHKRDLGIDTHTLLRGR